MKRSLYNIITICLFVIFLGIFFHIDYQNERMVQHDDWLRMQAEPYDEEIQNIRTAVNRRYKALRADSGMAGVVLGFIPASVEDVELAYELTSGYDFIPAIILDCTMSESKLKRIAGKAVQNRFDILFTGKPFNKDVMTTAENLRKELMSRIVPGQKQTFLLRASDYNEDNRSLLENKGYLRMFLYSETLNSGKMGNIDFLPYGLVHSSGTVDSMANSIEAAHVSALVIFDFKDIHSETMTKQGIADALGIIKNHVSAGRMEYRSIEEAFVNLTDEDLRKKREKEEYEEYAARQYVRIRELRKKLDQIYTHWDEY